MAEQGDIEVCAHRGFSSRFPEMTRAAYRAAIELSERLRVPIGIECDVQLSADEQLVCLHDLTVDRTSAESGPVLGRSLAELRSIDFGVSRIGPRSADDGSIVSLDDLMVLTAQAIERGAQIRLNVETKHPNPRGFAVEDRLAEALTRHGCDDADSPVRVISFSPSALSRIGRLLPRLSRTYLVDTLTPVADGRLPDGIDIVGPELALLQADPDFVGRARSHGTKVHVWTVNEVDDIEFCLELGVDAITTDCPDRVFEALRRRGRLRGAPGHA